LDDVAISDGLVMLLSDEIVYFINLTKSQNPIIANDTIAAENNVYTILSYDHYLITLGFSVFTNSSIQIFDIENCSKPELLANVTESEYIFEDGFTFDDYLYVDSHDFYGSNKFHLVYNLTNIEATYLHSVNDYLGTFVNAKIGEEIVLFVNASLGAMVYNFSQPTTPVFIKTIRGNYSSYYNDVIVSLDNCYLINNIYGIELFSFVDLFFTYESTISKSSYAEDIFSYGEYLFIAEGFGGLEIINATDPSNPIKIGQFLSQQGAYYKEVVIEDDLAYILDLQDYNLELVDLSDVSTPVFQGAISITPTWTLSLYGLAVKDSIAYIYGTTISLVGDYWSLLSIDCSDPTNPQILDESTIEIYISPLSSVASRYKQTKKAVVEDSSYGTVGIAIQGNYLYGGGKRLQVYDITNPSNLKTASVTINYPNSNFRYYRDITISDNYAFLANSYDTGMSIFDLQNKQDVHQIGYLNITESMTLPFGYFLPYKISFNNNIAYLTCLNTISNDDQSILMINCTDINQPKLVGYYIDSKQFTNIHAIGNLVFATAGYSGSLVVKHDSLEIIWPPAPTTQPTRLFGYESFLLLLTIPVIYICSKKVIQHKRKEGK
jgi:hypothetical protein